MMLLVFLRLGHLRTQQHRMLALFQETHPGFMISNPSQTALQPSMGSMTLDSESSYRDLLRYNNIHGRLILSYFILLILGLISSVIAILKIN